MPKKKREKYKYYQFIVRVKKELGPATLKALKCQLWEYLGDVAITDVQARQCSMPVIRFKGDDIVRK